MTIAYCSELNVFRIFAEIKAGTLGGYIQKEENLSDNAWISDDAKVCDDAKIYGEACVSGDEIKSRKDVCYISNRFYDITIMPLHIKIGCQYHSKEAWWNFTDEQIKKMDGQNALDFWKIWKEPLKQICDTMKIEKEK